MPQIIINNCSHTSNIEAMELCLAFIKENQKQKNKLKYQSTQVITGQKNNKYRITELPHPDEEDSPCSVIFEVVRILGPVSKN